MCSIFRKMRRFKQQMSDTECIEVLSTTKIGVLSISGEDRYPYRIPMNHWYSKEDGKIYFHMIKEGHKIDVIKFFDKASFCVYLNKLQGIAPLEQAHF